MNRPPPAAHTHSEPGGGSPNEDAFEVGAHPRDPGCTLVAVADGQGGRAGGALAARGACRIFLGAASRLVPEELLDQRAWDELLRGVDEALLRERRAGLTTLVALCMVQGKLRGSSCGDSAAVLVTASRDAVILTERQRKNPPVGSGSARFAGFAAELRPPWTVMAMTDGVWKYAGWEKVIAAAALDSPEETVAALREAAALPTGALQDDFTLAVFRDDGS
jgi:hypothetical protein